MSSALPWLSSSDLLFGLLAQEMVMSRLQRCIVLMQNSEVDKYRGPQLLQGGGDETVLDYIPYIATMMRLDAASPYAKTTGRRGRMNRMHKATCLDAVDLDELAAIGNMRNCENFRESVITTARGIMKL